MKHFRTSAWEPAFLTEVLENSFSKCRHRYSFKNKPSPSKSLHIHHSYPPPHSNPIQRCLTYALETVKRTRVMIEKSGSETELRCPQIRSKGPVDTSATFRYDWLYSTLWASTVFACDRIFRCDAYSRPDAMPLLSLNLSPWLKWVSGFSVLFEWLLVGPVAKSSLERYARRAGI
jgi:hypothetical protein